MARLDQLGSVTDAVTVLVVGATGATGRLLVGQLLEAGTHVRVIVRSADRLPEKVRNHSNLSIIIAPVLDIDDAGLAEHVGGCSAVVSCLGHTMDFKGLFGHPRRLCSDAVARLCLAIEENTPDAPVRFILMNTVGVENPGVDAQRTFLDRRLLALLRCILPPQRDNEGAALYLRQQVGVNNRFVEWCAVRPDSLINADVSGYEICESPVTGLVSGRPTTRANVAHFMAALAEGSTLWQEWKYRMPVIMNAV